MREAVVVASSRTPLAKSFRGSFNLTRPDDLAAHCITDVLKKVPQLDPAEIEDVIPGLRQSRGHAGHERGPHRRDPRRPAGDRGRRDVNRFCSSGLQAIALAAHLIINEGADVAIGGGVESITAIAGRRGEPNPWVKEHKPGIYMVMGDTAEVVAKRYKISRQAQDEYSLSSQQRTARAQAEGFFDEELAPMTVTRGILDKKTGEVVGKEEHTIDQGRVQPAPTRRSKDCSALKPYFDPDSGQGTRHGRQRLADVRRRQRHACSCRASGPKRWASSRSSSSAAFRSPAASRTKWASARCSPCPSCSSATA